MPHCSFRTTGVRNARHLHRYSDNNQWQACTTHCVRVWSLLWTLPYIFALTSMSLRDCPLLWDIIGGSLNMFFSKGWFCIKFQFCINIFLRLRTDGWYVVTKGKICLRVFFFCCRADCLFAKLTSDNVVCIISWGYPRVMRRDLKFEILSSNVVSEEFVLSSLSASPLIKPLFTPTGWLEVKCVYWKVSVGLYSKNPQLRT